jgi:heme-degrading monooxygenase HmoA
MVVEHAVLEVRPGEEEAFEAAFAEARPLIEATEGFQGLRLLRCEERSNVYLLLVDWRSTQDHVVGFRESDRFLRWRELLHHFYDPAPLVEHFAEV